MLRTTLARGLVAGLVTAGLVVAQAGPAGAQPPKTTPGTMPLTGLPTAPAGRFEPDGISTPATVSAQDGTKLDVFQNVSGQIQQKTWTVADGWSRPRVVGPMPFTVQGTPAAVTTQSGDRIDLFVVGQDNHPYWTAWTPGTGWGTPEDLGGRLISWPSAAYAGAPDRIDLFGIGTDSRLYQKTHTAAGGWTPWVTLSSPPAGFGSAPSATWTADGNRLDVFVRGAADGHLYQLAWNASPAGWSGWADLGGVLTSAPSASWVSLGNRIDVFVVGTDGKLYQKVWSNDTNAWRGWFPFEQPPAGAGGAPSVNWSSLQTRLDVFTTGESDGGVYQKRYEQSAGWRAWENV
ncbi:hypothetical protein [Actinocrispum sp. NPDC049592]|uniref:hypothetical protein n=1 Tax=Actinocrispum sp. NPDC049592 TaxID=3154835 RepID=UPI00342249BD